MLTQVGAIDLNGLGVEVDSGKGLHPRFMESERKAAAARKQINASD
jgi:hypothetical protein